MSVEQEVWEKRRKESLALKGAGRADVEGKDYKKKDSLRKEVIRKPAC